MKPVRHKEVFPFLNLIYISSFSTKNAIRPCSKYSNFSSRPKIGRLGGRGDLRLFASHVYSLRILLPFFSRMYPKCKLGKVFRLCGWAWAHSVIVRVTVLLTLDKHGRSCLCTRLRPQQNAQRTNNCTFVCAEHLLLSQRSAKSLLKDRTPFLLHCCTTTRAVGRSM